MEDFISAIRRTHDAVFESIEAALSPWFLGLAARLIFASVTLNFFLASARTKVVDVTGSESAPLDYFTLEPGALAQIAPKALEHAGFDTSQVGFEIWLIAYAGTLAEFVLPVLLLFGLFTRLSALGMIGFIAVMTWVDVTGHGTVAFDTAKLFDRAPSDLIMDQRLMWLFPLIYLVVRGAGWVSVDAIIGRPAERVSLA